MGRSRYTNIVVKRTHVTREEALICLNVTSDEFDRLCVLTDTHPYIPTKDKLTNRSTRIQYRINDIHRIRESDPYKKELAKEDNARKKEKYTKQGRLQKIKDLPEDRIDYPKIILDKYPSFDDVYEDLGECITLLFIAERVLRETKLPKIRYEQNILHKAQKELALFYLFNLLTCHRYKVFLTNSRIFYSTEINEYNIFWSEAFPLEDKEDALGINASVLVHNMEFCSYLLEKVNFCLFKRLNPASAEFLRAFREEKTDSNGVKSVDGSVAGNIVLKDLLNKYKSEYKILPSESGMFNGHSFYLHKCKALTPSLYLLILSNGGTITEEESTCSFYVCSSLPDPFIPTQNYVNAQFVYDSCNQQVILEPKMYRPGQELPLHLCPFKSALESTELDLFNLSERKKEKLMNLANHRK